MSIENNITENEVKNTGQTSIPGSIPARFG
jgi:hypothetical protein